MFIFILEAARLREGWHEPLETWFQLGSAHVGWPLLGVSVAGVSRLTRTFRDVSAGLGLSPLKAHGDPCTGLVFRLWVASSSAPLSSAFSASFAPRGPHVTRHHSPSCSIPLQTTSQRS